LNIDENVKRNLKELIAKKNKNGIIHLLSKESIDDKYKKILINILDFQGDIDVVILMAEKHFMNSGMKIAIEELKALRDFFETNKLKKMIHFDLSMIPDLDYYDGIIFKGYYFSSSKKIISGGRYDRLSEKFKKKVSAIGFSINMDEMMKVIIQKGKMNE
jgi:ATP phosphoribosyltransferase regulatory subunit